MTRAVRAAWPAVLLILVVSVVAAVMSTGPESLQTTCVTLLVNLVLVIGLYVFVGTSGVFSFGQTAFMAIGAYATAILAMDAEQKRVLLPEMFGVLQDVHLAPLPATIVGGLVAALVGLVLSLPLMRLSGLTAGLATFSFLLLVGGVAENWTPVTNAESGISGIPQTVSIAVALAWAAAIIVIAAIYGRSGSAMRLRASREDDVAARSSGVRIARERRVAFCLSAFIVGIGGGLFAQAQGAIQPSAFGLSITFLIIAMLVVGGMSTLSGAVVGTLLLSLVGELLGRAENGTDLFGATIDLPTGAREVGLAALMIGALVLRPSGVVGRREITWPVRDTYTRPPELRSAAPLITPRTEGQRP